MNKLPAIDFRSLGLHPGEATHCSAGHAWWPRWIAEVEVLPGLTKRLVLTTFDSLPANWDPARGATVAYNGDVWVERERNFDDSLPTFDVIDSRGTHVRRVALRDHTRLVGLWDGFLYAVRIDQDDLEHLQRYRIP